jgi:hypothetical protein
MRTVLRPLIAVAALLAIAVPSLAGAASTAAVPTRHLPVSGGKIKWAVEVRNANTCRWGSSPEVAGFDGTVKCKPGRVVRPATFQANTSTGAKDYTLDLVMRGTTRTVVHLKVVEAGKPTSTTTTSTTTTTLPPTSTTTTSTTTTTQPATTTTTTTQPFRLLSVSNVNNEYSGENVTFTGTGFQAPMSATWFAAPQCPDVSLDVLDSTTATAVVPYPQVNGWTQVTVTDGYGSGGQLTVYVSQFTYRGC